jgi:hypothetical protein
MKKFFSVVGIVLGIVIIILGLYLAFGHKSFKYTGAETLGYVFGADFYTEEYSATENAADNILALGNYLAEVTKFILFVIGLLFSAFGGVIVCHFGCKLSNAKNNQKNPAVSGTIEPEALIETSEELPEL